MRLRGVHPLDFYCRIMVVYNPAGLFDHHFFAHYDIDTFLNVN